MKISIVTAVYNRIETIGQAVASVQSQTYPDIEHVIQDGGSSDGTIDLINRLATAKTSLESQQDGGIYDAINTGIRRATGDVVGLLHSDDYLTNSHVVEKIAQAFEDPAVDAVYGDLDYVSAADCSRVVRHWRAGEFHPGKLSYGWMPPHPTVYLRSRVFQMYGNYNTSFRIAADYDAMLRYFGTAQVQALYIPEVLVKMRVGGESNASLSKILQKSKEDLRALRENRIGGYGALIMKNIRKLPQFVVRTS